MGPVPTDPWSAGIMALGSIANSPAAMPGSATQGVGPYSSTFDDSGWSINFGSGTSSAVASTATGSAAVAGGILKNPVVLLALVAVLVLYLKK